MRGTVKLSIGGVLAGYEEYRDEEHRDRILLYWISTHHLQGRTYTITIIPDEEEVERAYYTERAKGFYRGRFKRSGDQGAGTASKPVEEIKVRQPAD